MLKLFAIVWLLVQDINSHAPGSIHHAMMMTKADFSQTKIWDGWWSIFACPLVAVAFDYAQILLHFGQAEGLGG